MHSAIFALRLLQKVNRNYDTPFVLTHIPCLIEIPRNLCQLNHILLTTQVLSAMSVPCHCWIFFTRVRAAYPDSRPVISIFAFLWLCCTNLAFCTILSFPVTVKQIDHGKCAISIGYHPIWLSADFIGLTIFDTAVIVAISMRIMTHSIARSWRSKLRLLVFGNEMGYTSRIFLQSSQVYYLYVYLTSTPTFSHYLTSDRY